MVDFMTADLNDIAHSLVADGMIDDVESEALIARLLDDEAIDQEEAEFLFEVNDIVSGNPKNSPDFGDFFVEAITAFVLQDIISPGVLDDHEWSWLRAMVGEDQDLDGLEIRLLLNIAEEATSVPADFDNFSKSFEEVEYEDEGEHTLFYARIARSLTNKIRNT